MYEKIITFLIISALIFADLTAFSAESFDGDDMQDAFDYYYTFYDTIEDPNFLEARLDAYCWGGQTGQGHAVASVEYDQVMLDSDYDIGTFVTVWAHEGDYQDPSHILYPDEDLRRALWSVNEQRWSDMDMTGNPVE